MQSSRPPEHGNNNNDDDDDDSHTTLSRGEEERIEFESCASSVDLLASPVSRRHNSIPSPRRPTAPSSPSSTQSVISPSTQTLNVLSQHDAAGGGNLRYDMNNLEQDASAVTASQQVIASEKDRFADWKIISMSLTKPGALGMTVRRLITEGSEGSHRYTMIKKVVPESQAEKAGVLVGDIVGAKYEEVIQWKDKPRPVTFCVLRQPPNARHKKQPTDAASPLATSRPATNTSSANTTNKSSADTKKPAAKSTTTTTKAAAAPKTITAAALKAAAAPNLKTAPTTECTVDKDVATSKTTTATTTITTTETVDPTNSQADQQAAVVLAHKLAASLLPPGAAKTANDDDDEPTPSPQGHDDNDTVPFCKACQKKTSSSSRPHHALCPQHPEFDNSGALEKLHLVRGGVKMGCEACKHFYQHGRMVDSSIAHLDDCPKGKQPLRKNGEVIDVIDNGPEAPLAAAEKNKSTSSKQQQGQKKRGATTASQKHSSVSGATENVAKSAASKKSGEGKGAAGNKSEPAKKKKGGASKKSIGRKSATKGSESQSVALASLNPGAEATQKTRASTTLETNAARRNRKKRRYEYESDSDSEEDTSTKEDIRLPTKRTVSKRAKFVEKGSDMPLVVDTAAKKKRQAPKKTSKKVPQTLAVNVDTQVKPVWVPCANPWGPSGYQEGDVALVTPSGGFTHHETVYGGPRFIVSPFGPNSDYSNTHRTPSEGFDVILLTRDPNAEHPWGFTYRRHEFGGACLVSSVDSLSPAASVVYRGNETDQSSGAHLRMHDMILSMNGKSIGGMTELGLTVELDVCGRELELVVARYRDAVGAARQLLALERSEWTTFDDAMNDKRRLDWFEMNGAAGAGAASTPTINMLEESDVSPFNFGGSTRESLNFGGAMCTPQQDGRPTGAPNSVQNQSGRPQQFSLSQLSLASPLSMTSRRSVPSQASRATAPTRRSDCSEAYHDDDEAWLDCVCGKAHPEPVRVFWIQCDDCRSWYNVAPVCVGFTELEASSVGTWVCPGCADSVTSDQGSAQTSSVAHSHSQPALPRGGFGKRLSAVSRSKDVSLARKTTVSTPSSAARVPVSNPFETPGSKSSKKRPQMTTSEILEERKRRRTDDGCFLPLRTPRKKDDGTYARPCGRAPPGMVWNPIQGKYTPKPKTNGRSKQKSVPTNVVVVPSRSVPTPSPAVAAPHPATKKSARVAQVSVEPQAAVPRPPTKKSARVAQIPVELQATSLGVPSPNARRTDDGCFLPLRTPKKKNDGTYARPCGRAPPGMAWDAIRGFYAPPIAELESKQKSAPNKEVDDACPQSKPKSTSESPNDKSVAAVPAPSTKGADGGAVSAAEKAPKIPNVKSVAAVQSQSSSTNGASRGPGGKKASKPKRGSREERDAEREQRMTQDGCLRPRSALKKNLDGTFARPRGRCPPGTVWDVRRGVFAPPKQLKTKSKPAASAPKALEQDTTTPPAGNTGVAKLGVNAAAAEQGTTAKPEVSDAAGAMKQDANDIGDSTGVVSPEQAIPVGTWVSVAERVWIGCNKVGGIGTVTDYAIANDGTITYNVKYSLGGRENGIHSRWVSKHDFDKVGSVYKRTK